MARCEFRYADGEQCIVAGLDNQRGMCADHNLLTQIAEDKRKWEEKVKRPTRVADGRPSRAKKREEPKPTLKERIPTDSRIHDHTAPWRCGLIGCMACTGKPSYNEYFAARAKGAPRGKYGPY